MIAVMGVTLFKKAIKHLHSIGEDDEWETPPDIFRAACDRYGHRPVLDVCATMATTKCKSFFGRDHPNSKYRECFDNFWNKDYFCNPPYSEKEKFIEYGIQQSIAWGVSGLFLIYAKTDTQWWADFVTANDFVVPHFHKGRIRFWKDGKPYKNSAPYGSAWLSIIP